MLFAALQVVARDPLFTNDLVGFIKILSVIVFVVLTPLAALVVYFLKRGPDSVLSQFKTDLNGYGSRLGAAEQKLSAVEERVVMIYETIASSQRDIMAAIAASGQAQIKATHEVEIQVARLQERSNLGDCMATFGASIERLATAMEKREMK